MPLLSLHLNVAYRGKPDVLRDVRLEIEPGETVGLVGQSGSGKSTLALSILGLGEMRGAKVTGRILFNGEDLVNAGEKRMRAIRGKEIALVLQSAISSLNPAMIVGGHLWEAWRAHSRDGRDLWRNRVRELFDDVSLPVDDEFLKRHPRELSVGIAQRVLIAMAVLHRPALLIADEPTSALDVITQAETLRLFGEMNRRFGTAILFISHDLLSVASLCGRVAILHEGAIVESGTTETIFSAPGHPYTAKLIAAMPALPTGSMTADLLHLAGITGRLPGAVVPVGETSRESDWPGRAGRS